MGDEFITGIVAYYGDDGRGDREVMNLYAEFIVRQLLNLQALQSIPITLEMRNLSQSSISQRSFLLRARH